MGVGSFIVHVPDAVLSLVVLDTWARLLAAHPSRVPAGERLAWRLLAKDPWIASGHLVAEYRTWFVAKKLFRPLKGAFTDVETCTFALLVRPPTAPELSSEERGLVQEGHMANINAMAKAGELLIAGPFEEDTSLRGVFVFRTTDRAKIEELVSKDPAVARGRLKVEPYTWYVSKGVLPAPAVP